ncbi:hypothetical protein TUM4438_41140 [Shewanella sairae]|uniref:dTDP-4-dehydrorhamnose reductase n=1 Tax=Shewanella sairae TaxID=190310 RepID=A0ABQ4PQV5_9GAMM|nr:dTDP-4-dehydrorhamnose reductase [Shewanella sairae]MCL1131387.1 dTDP-4-dehydrorhamnose reductase [Shewanella sairae]GIU51453.1 hypothetical protein TUM4438_41140 [Shewanella sairae]
MRILITGAKGQLAQSLALVAVSAHANVYFPKDLDKLKNDVRSTDFAKDWTKPSGYSEDFSAAFANPMAQDALIELLPELIVCLSHDDEVILLSRQELNICDNSEVERAFNVFSPDIVINCAAFTAVDAAEVDRLLAFELNVTGPKLIANACRTQGIKMLHISTDFVFDGLASTAYKEACQPKPLSQYGLSKLSGEQWVSDILGKDVTIVRTAWLYSCWGNNFVKTMQRFFSVKQNLSVVADQHGSPTWGEALAVVLFLLCRKPDTSAKTSLYHYAAAGCCSWFEFACEIQSELQPDIGNSQVEQCTIAPISSANWQALHVNQLAKRPPRSELCCDKIYAELKLNQSSLLVASWQQQLAAMLQF